ncbi:MAG: hypothetical protein FJ292_09590 [Planctomycetes bacterium]|nr:hypothetical protein [Planctomycetota bacterium]
MTTPTIPARRVLIPSALVSAAFAAMLLAARPAPTVMQDPRCKVVSIASESTPYGMSLFRLWSNGDMEVMVLGQSNTWSDWTAVAPGKSGFAPGTKTGD